MSERIIPQRNLEENVRDCLIWCTRPEVLVASKKVMNKRLKETIEVGKGQLYAVYRSAVLARYAGKVLKTYGGRNKFDTFLTQRKSAIESVSVLDASFYDPAVQRHLERPKSLLLAALNETVEDGASEVVSYGFIDVQDAPPWDTWVDLVEGRSGTKYLLSWVPQSMTEYVDKAIEANCASCLAWAKYNHGKIKRISPD